jgi:hypothetical protein
VSRLALLAVLLVVTTSAAQKMPTTFYVGQLAPVGNALTRLAGPSTSCAQCESGTFAASGAEHLSVDCDGTCEARLVCRFPSGVHDAVLAAILVTDAELHTPVETACDTAWFQILRCDPTTLPDGTTRACKVRAWLF